MTTPLRRTLAISTVALLVSTFSFAQSEKEIIAQYTKALQKSADEKELHSLVAMGDIVVQKLSFPTAIYYKAPSLTRVEMDFQTLKFLQVSNDSIKWEYNPFDDKHTITRVDESDDGGLPKKNSSFDFISSDLIRYEALGYHVKFKGKEKLDSIAVQVLTLSKDKKSEVNTTFYINTRNGLLYKVEDEKGYRYFADYSVTDGFVFPTFVLDSSPKQVIQMRFTQLAFNKPVPDTLFIIPAHVLEHDNKSINSFDALMARGDARYGEGQYDSAEMWYSKAIAKDNQQYLAFNARGLARVGQKRYYEAIADFNSALEIQPKGSKAFNNRGLSKFFIGDRDGAIADYGRAIELEPDFKTALKNRGTAYIQGKDYDAAARDFMTVIKLDSKDGEAHYKYGVVLAQLERYEDALASYTLAMDNQILVPDVYNYKGVSEFKLERFDSAAANFKKAHAMNNENLQYLENYGRALYEMGDYSAASGQFEIYLRKNNDNAEIHNLNGLCKYHDENYKGAIRDFTKSIDLNGSNATYYDNRAASKEMLEDYVGTIEDYSASIRIYPNDASVFYKRGLIKILTSKKIEGCLDLATANEMEYEPAKEAILKNCN